jgi:tetratricopeptide (TPR) repeat protein
MTRRARKRILIALTALGVVGLAVGGGALVHRGRILRQTEHARQDGFVAVAAGDHESAMRNLSLYCSRNHNDGEAVLALARARAEVPAINNRHITTGIAYARAAADLMPADLRPQELLLDLYGRAGFLTERIETADRILSLSVGHHDALQARASGLAQVGRAQDALAAARKFAAAFPEDVAAHRLVVSLMHTLNQPRESIRSYVEELAAAHPDNARLLVLQSQVVAQTDIEAAAKLARRAADLPLRSAESVMDLLWLLDRLQPAHPELGEAADTLMAREIDGPLALTLAPSAAERAWRRGLVAEAHRLVRKVADQTGLATAPDAIIGWCALTEGASPSGVPADSAVAQLRARATPDAASWSGLLETKLALDANNFAAARTGLARAGAAGRATDGRDALAAFYSADLDNRVGESRSAIRQWQELLRQDPGWRTVRLALVAALRQQGQVNEAAAIAQAGLTTRLPRQEALVLAECLVERIAHGHPEQRQVDVALGVMADLERQAPSDPATLSLATRTFVAAGRVPEAQARARRLLEVAAPSPHQPPFTPSLIEAAEAIRPVDSATAASLVERARALDPTSARVARATAVGLASSGNLAEAKKALSVAVESSQGEERLQQQLRLGAFLDQTKDPQAASFLTALAEEHPTTPAAQLALLESGAARTQKDASAKAITRLREVAGDESTLWRTHQARWLLTFDASPSNAAKAIPLLGEVLRVDPHDVAARSLMAEALLVLKDRDGAITHLTAAVDGDSSGVALYPRLIELLQEAGRSEELSHRLMLFRIAPIGTPELRRQRARVMASQRQWDQAAADYAALEASSTLEDRFAQASIAVRQGDLALARRLVVAMAQSPEITEPMISFAADVHCADGHPELADELLAYVPTSTPERRQFLRAAYMERHARNTEAQTLYANLAQGGGAEPLAELARFYLKTGRLQEAAATIEKARAADPKNPQVLKIGGLVRVATGGSKTEGLSDLAAAVEGSEQSASLLRLTRALQALDSKPDDLETFATTIEQLTRDDPAFFPAWRLLVEVRWRQGQTDAAITAAQSAVRANPTLADAPRLATQVLAAAGRTTSALNMARRWLDLSVVNPLEATIAMARLQGADGHADEALRLLELWASRITADSDKAPEAVELLARVLADNRRDQEAHDLLWARAASSRDWALRYLSVGVAQREPGAARRWLTRVEPLLAADADGAFALGHAWLRFCREHPAPEVGQADWARASDFLRRGLDSASNKAMAAQFLGECSHMSGDLAGAERYYRMALKEQPDNTSALNNLATILMHDAATRKEAIQLARHAVDVTRSIRPTPPQYRSYLETLASALRSDSQFAEAERAYRLGLQMDPTAIDLSVGLAEAILAQGRRQEAVTVVRKLDSVDASRATVPSGAISRLVALRQQLSGSMSPSK